MSEPVRRQFSPAETVFNITNLLVHIATFMPYDAGRHDSTECDHAWRLQLLVSRTMTAANRRSVQIPPRKYAPHEIKTYVDTRFTHIMLKLYADPKALDGTPVYLTTNSLPSVMTVDLPILVSHMESWAVEKRPELVTSTSANHEKVLGSLVGTLRDMDRIIPFSTMQSVRASVHRLTTLIKGVAANVKDNRERQELATFKVEWATKSSEARASVEAYLSLQDEDVVPARFRTRLETFDAKLRVKQLELSILSPDLEIHHALVAYSRALNWMKVERNKLTASRPPVVMGFQVTHTWPTPQGHVQHMNLAAPVPPYILNLAPTNVPPYGSNVIVYPDVDLDDMHTYTSQ
jgi:hypothetical protein